jgi:hypothetical protein
MKNAEQELELVPDSEAGKVESMERVETPAIWDGFRAQLEKLKVTAETLVITDISQTAEMKIARTTRLTLKDLRVAIEKRRKELGEDYLRKTQKINSAAKELKDLIEPLEERLLEQEKFVERLEEKRKMELKESRTQLLAPFGVDVSFYNLAEMPEESFGQLLESTKSAHEAKIAAAKKAEEDRIAKEKSDAEDRERVRLENERLKKEALEREAAAAAERKRIEAEKAAAEESARKEREEIEAKAKAEREAIEKKAKAERDEAARIAAEQAAKAEAEKRAMEAAAKKEREALEAKARQEREAREKIEAELRAKAEAEKKAQEEKEAAEKKAAAAPDKEKLATFAAAIRAISAPKLESNEGAKLNTLLAEQIEKFAAWVEKQASNL